jgi:hypothetical protein
MYGGRRVYVRLSTVVDTPGEFRNKWEAVTSRKNPHGIIILATPDTLQDTRQDIVWLSNLYLKFFENHRRGEASLSVVSVFLSKSDEWAQTISEMETKLAKFKQDTETDIESLQRTFGSDLVIHYGAGSVVDKRFIGSAEAALSEFARSLNEPI